MQLPPRPDACLLAVELTQALVDGLPRVHEEEDLVATAGQAWSDGEEGPVVRRAVITWSDRRVGRHGRWRLLSLGKEFLRVELLSAKLPVKRKIFERNFSPLLR